MGRGADVERARPEECWRGGSRPSSLRRHSASADRWQHRGQRRWAASTSRAALWSAFLVPSARVALSTPRITHHVDEVAMDAAVGGELGVESGGKQMALTHEDRVAIAL